MSEAQALTLNKQVLSWNFPLEADGKKVDVPLQEINGYCPAKQLEALLENGPVVLTARATILLHGTESYESNYPIKMLVVHGSRDEKGHHIGYPQNVPTVELVSAIQRYYELRSRVTKGDERIKLFLSCDEGGAMSIDDEEFVRWDQQQKGRELGAVGFAGGLNYVRLNDLKETLSIDATSAPNNPFQNEDHPNRWIVMNGNPPPFRKIIQGKLIIPG